MLFPTFLYLFLASSHQLYADLWFDFFSNAGPLGKVGLTTSLGDADLLQLHGTFLSGCILLPLLRHLFTFLYLCYIAIYFPLWVVHPSWINNTLLIHWVSRLILT